MTMEKHEFVEPRLVGWWNEIDYCVKDGLHRLDPIHTQFHSGLIPSAAQPASEPERVSDEAQSISSLSREQLLEYIRNVESAHDAELRTLRAQVAEKDAAIEKARQGALAEVEALSTSLYLENDNRWNRCVRAYRDAIRALAAQKKEG